MKSRRRSTTERVRETTALAALLAHGSVAGASASCGLSESTLRRLIRRSDFRERLDKARGAILGATISGLAGVSAEALAALRRNLTCGNASAEVRAASALLAIVLAWERQRAELGKLAELQQQVADLIEQSEQREES